MGVNDEKASEKLFDNKTAMAMGGNSTRPCDACGAKRARWFCAADAAYLCHACDTSIHAANSVACRHNRVRLTPSGVRYGGLLMDSETSWPRKKTRSERRHKITLLPSLDTDSGCLLSLKQNHGDGTEPDPQLFLKSESDLFRAEVEDLNLASFISPGSHGNNYHYLEMCNNNDNCEGSNPMADEEPPFSWLFDRVKIEESDDRLARVEAEAGPEELFDLNIDLFDLTANLVEGDDMKVENCYFNDEERKICLTLNYEDVLSAWSDRGSLWTYQNTTERTKGIEYGVVPDLNLNLRSGSCGEQIEQVPVKAAHLDRERKYKYCIGREARVLRYREKRRSRLFSKTIRYHVRKLNAEKRPRMKGRFVKTAGNVLSEGIADENKWS